MQMTKEQAAQLITGALNRYFAIGPQEATPDQMYKACATVARDILLERRNANNAAVKAKQHKRLFYFSIEFLLGRSLKNNLHNIGITDSMNKALLDMGFELDSLYELEPDAGLGNGGLGRLAACYLDAMASQDLPAYGFSILYEYGLFRQKIVEGWQTELPDIWLPGGDVWLIPRADLTFDVRFGGHVQEVWTPDGLRVELVDYDEVEAVPYDMMVSGASETSVSLLRLWRAREKRKFDMNLFSRGDYASAVATNTNAEAISMVLYPADHHVEGQSLRLKQQYFLVSASLQYITKYHFHRYRTFENFAEKVAIHINDTHPALCIPELMRILLDDYHLSWDEAFAQIKQCMAYTNHTVMSEALEKWPEELMRNLLPRVYQIIAELNKRFCGEVWARYPGDWDRAARMALINGGQVRMANLAIVGSHAVNGVSALHSDILKADTFRDFYQWNPEQFHNVTNGIAHRRWLCQCNPGLTSLLTECIGDGFVKHPEALEKFRAYESDAGVLARLGDIKSENKVAFASMVAERQGQLIPTDAMFDVQVKRLHEYKRQLLNALHIFALYRKLRDNPNMDFAPRVFIFGAKAAPGYQMAKRIINFIVNLGEQIQRDKRTCDKLHVVFMENYCVSVAERLMPAAEVSEQISLAGKEASGTGNMKLMINGALTLGTMDGANVEIHQAVGDDNIFIFGLRTEEVEEKWRQGYNATYYYQRNPELKAAIDELAVGVNGVAFPELAHYLLVGDYGVADPYMCLADYDEYANAHQRAAELYADPAHWNRMSLHNIAGAGAFAADRAILEYARDIWKIEPLRDK